MSSAPPSQPRPAHDNAVARASAPLVRWISSMPPIIPVLFVLGLVVLGGLLPWGWVLLALASLILLWVLAISWPRLTSSERLLRLAVIALVVAVCVVRAFPR